MWEQIIPIINKYQRFVITSHQNPDGDAIGSELGLAGHLHHLGKEVTIINHDPLPEAFRFLDKRKWVKCFTKTHHVAIINRAEVIIVVDASGGWKRMGNAGDACQKSPAIKVCIDHHPDTADFADVAVIDTTAAAAAELIFELLVAMEASFSKAMAKALYTGILTDTGQFRFPKTSTRTHQIVAQLILHGAEPYLLYKQIYEQSSANRVRLKGEVFMNMKFEANGQVAYFAVTQAMLTAHQVQISELDGFASLGQEIKGVRVVVYALDLMEGRVKLSLRSDDTVAVNEVAKAYGGGGHHAAAGATTSGKIDEVLADAVQRVIALINESTPVMPSLADLEELLDEATT